LNTPIFTENAHSTKLTFPEFFLLFFGCPETGFPLERECISIVLLSFGNGSTGMILCRNEEGMI
jgi:hypothetical protein